MTARRATKRWLDGDCPKGVLAIFDNQTTFDRYTIFYADPTKYAKWNWYSYLGASENPTHPQGFGQHGEMVDYKLANYRRINYRHSCRWSDLPEAVRKLVISDLNGE